MLSWKALREQLAFGSSNRKSNLGGGSACLCCTSVIPVAFYERKEPAIILKNESSYQVSFWVIEEDKTNPTKSALDKISKEMGAPLDDETPSGPPTAGAMKERDDCYVLTADHRVDNWGTTVPFLKGSNDMRVIGFFRRNSSETWRRYKNRVYSIRRGKKIFTLVATDENIKRHRPAVHVETSDKTNDNQDVAILGQTGGGELDTINCQTHP